MLTTWFLQYNRFVIKINNLIFISTSSQLKFIVLNRNNFLSTFFFFEVYRGWNFVCWINIGMIMDNSFIIPWILYLDFQVTINNKVRFMIFIINILNVQVSIIVSKSKLPILLVLSFSPQKKKKMSWSLYLHI